MTLLLKLIGCVFLLFFALDLILFSYSFYQSAKLNQSVVLNLSEHKSGYKKNATTIYITVEDGQILNGKFLTGFRWWTQKIPKKGDQIYYYTSNSRLYEKGRFLALSINKKSS